MNSPKYLDIVFNLGIDKSLQYKCPPELSDKAQPGMRVLVSLNRRIRTGLIVACGLRPKVKRVLAIKALPDETPLLDKHLMDLLQWVSGYYLSPPGLVLRVAVPRAVFEQGFALDDIFQRRKLYAEPLKSAIIGKEARLSLKQRRIMEILSEAGGMYAARLVHAARTDYRTLHAMHRQGRISLSHRINEEGSAGAEGKSLKPRPLRLTEVQLECARKIRRSMDPAKYKKIILHEALGNGAMDILLWYLEHYLPPDRQALLLVPELSMAPLIMSRLERIFPGEIALLHGRLPEGQKRASWLKSRRGGIRVILGSRSAVFTPLPRLGIIFVYEEQEPTFKSEESPRYHARDVAIERARLLNIPVVLSSAAPSLEMYSSREKAETLYIKMPPDRHLEEKTHIQIVDMKEEKGRETTIFSGQLKYNLRSSLSHKEKAILFVNRRGMASAVFCGSCHFMPRCLRCSTALSYNDESGLMVCRTCGHRESIFLTCPRCGGTTIRQGSPGTRGVEREIAAIFPKARTARMDRDSLAKKGSVEMIIKDFDQGKIDILIGTQLLAKGFRWPEVSLVGIVDADTALHRPDFRASERTLQLIAQIIGQGGRSFSRKRRIIIQTRYPEHYAIQAILTGDQDRFYEQEMALRRELGFPPEGKMILLIIEETAGEILMNKARILRKAIDDALLKIPWEKDVKEKVEILGPHTAPLRMKRMRQRQQILLKGPSLEIIRELAQKSLWDVDSRLRQGKGKLIIDVDPIDFL